MHEKDGGNELLGNFWTLSPEVVAGLLNCNLGGLTTPGAEERLRQYGRNELREQESLSRLRLYWSQVRSPLQLLLVFASVASAITGAWADAIIVLSIVVVSSGIGYWREYNAGLVAATLQARIRVVANVLRDGLWVSVPFDGVVPGDIIRFSAGSLIPADAVLLEASHCYVSEAPLTGESFPVQKRTGTSSSEAGLTGRFNCVFAGCNVRSGTATGLVVRTGRSTQFGSIAHRLALRPPETEFDRGVRRFGYMLTVTMLVITLVVFAGHALRGRPAMETLLFAIALAVGLSPELLPAILSVSLARSAQAMALRGVLVRRLNAIENLGSMDVLCTDKTGTLTEGVVKLEGAYDLAGHPSSEVLELASINAAMETGLANPLDDAILEAHSPRMHDAKKLAEIPFDFTRKRVSIVFKTESGTRLVSKGAFEHIIDICAVDEKTRAVSEQQYRAWSERGIRVVAVASRRIDDQPCYGVADEVQLHFCGFLTFVDRPKETAAKALAELCRLGITVKVITGDSRFVAKHVAHLVGMKSDRTLTGADLNNLHDEALWHAAEQTDLFAEVDPNQKERIILSLRKMGHVVGFLGDGVNDAPAMHSADTSLCVDKAVDVARQAADFVLLEKSLHVIRDGVEEGRKTFANTLKYVLTTTSANLGNMVSMAIGSFFLPFLPLLAGQILLNNFLSDIPAVGMANDTVDHELMAQPRRWDMRLIRRFMIEFGILSSIFDLLTFAMLLQLFRASVGLFRTGWFVESLLTELAIALVVRTRRPFFKSRPGSILLWSTVSVFAVTLILPYLSIGGFFGFVPLPGSMIVLLVGIVGLYVVSTEILKQWFYR